MSQSADSLLEASFKLYSYYDFEESIKLAQKGLEISEDQNYQEGIIRGEFYLLISQQEGDPSTYDPKPIESLLVKMNLAGMTKDAARAHTFLAGVYAFFGDIEKSIENHLSAIQIYETADDLNGLASVYSNLSLVYYDQKDYEEAFFYVRKSIQIQRGFGEEADMHSTINNLAIIFEKTGPIDSAIFYHQLALEEAQKNKDAYSVGLSLSNLGNNYAEAGQLDLAEKTLLEALSIRDSIGYSRGLAYTHNRLANLYLETNKPTKAKFHAEQSLAHAEKSSEVKVIRMAYERLQEVAQKTGDYREELNYLKKATALKDSILNESNTKSITQLMLNYEFQKKQLIDSLKNEQEKKDLGLGFVERLEAAQSRQILLLISVLLFLALAIGLFHRNQFIKKSTRIITKEKEKSDKLLLNILPEAVAEELKEKGYSEARDFDEVTVIFTDFVDFTKKAQHLSAKELVTELNTCFKAFDQIVVDCGLEKIKTIGDAYMAAGGLNMKAKAKEVAIAAIRMKEFIDQRNNDPELSEKIKFDMRCGINTGPVAAGIVGIKKFQYDIWGDTVNTAQRMEANCEINNINVSENTYQLIKDVPEFTFEARGLLSVKGKGKMSMWYLRKKTFSNG
jgi:class 3 adenylate cyclase/lipopolysaccharide biosynthesis regulator YciM